MSNESIKNTALMCGGRHCGRGLVASSRLAVDRVAKELWETIGTEKLVRIYHSNFSQTKMTAIRLAAALGRCHMKVEIKDVLKWLDKEYGDISKDNLRTVDDDNYFTILIADKVDIRKYVKTETVDNCELFADEFHIKGEALLHIDI